MDFNDQRTLGRTGILAGRLGVAGGYGAPAEAYEMAFERGCNYFYWSSPRKKGMGEAIRNVCKNGKRDDLVVVLQSYSRSPWLMDYFFNKGLKDVGLEVVDVLLLGWHNKPPSVKIMERAKKMQKEGRVRCIAVSSHNRKLFPQLETEKEIDLFHLRYNPSHRGAENEVFSHLDPDSRAGIVSYTATRWGHLLDAKKMPKGEAPLTASDCYRFALSNPAVDVAITGPKNMQQMKEALYTLDKGPLTGDEMRRVMNIGDYVRQHSSKFR